MKIFRKLTATLLGAAAVLALGGCTESTDHDPMIFDNDRAPLTVTFGGDEVIFFEYDEQKIFDVAVTGAETVETEAPEGWTATYADGRLTVAAPATTDGAELGLVVVRASNAAAGSRQASQRVCLNAAIPEVKFADEGPIGFEPGEKRSLRIESSYVTRYETTVPDGWKASCEGGNVEVTAPASAAEGAMAGEIVVTAYGRDDRLNATASIAVRLEVDATPLDSEQTANCYIVSTPGYYSFDARVMGNGVYKCADDQQTVNLLPVEGMTDASIRPVFARLLWQDSPDMIGDVALIDGRICVVVKHIDGNAVVAATDADGVILWSWHLWGTARPSEQRYPANEFGRSYTMLDRNLGAWGSRPGDAGVGGLLYEWGRKDPFVGGAETLQVGFEPTPFDDAWSHPTYDIRGERVRFASEAATEAIGTMSYAIRHPMTYLYGAKTADGTCVHWHWSTTAHFVWGNPLGYLGETGVKTMYDPCPPGYRTPAADVWYDSATFDDENVFVWDAVNGGRSIRLDGQDIYYPAAGYRDYTEFPTFDYGQGRLWHVGRYGDYWSNSPSFWRNNQTGVAHILYSYYWRITMSYTVTMSNEGYRAGGHSIRCMKDSE